MKRVERYNFLPESVFIHPTTAIDHGCIVGIETKVWHFSHIADSARIGENCNIGQNCYIAGIIGDRCKIQNNVSIYKGVEIGDNVFLGPSCVFTNVLRPRAFIEQKDNFQKTIIKRGATIGANATIVCGITIGEYAFVGAGSVVTKDVRDYGLVVGNPARLIGKVTKKGNKTKEYV